MLSLPPLSLYIHLPWCEKKCPYCDFNSHQAPEKIPENDYIDALTADLASQLDFVQSRPLHSIFFGGGTPSLFSTQTIGSILERIEKHTPFSHNIEITLEANPSSANTQDMRALRTTGVNRLSIGVQSFNNDHLRTLGRVHDKQQALQTVHAAQNAGFSRINLDIMHGLPAQTVNNAIDDLQQAMGMEVEHISWYQLTLEPNTVFYQQRPTLPDEITLAAIEDQGLSLLKEHGYQRYEISAYTRNQGCDHNLNYWQFGDYLGIGAGAHSKITLPAQQQIRRHYNLKQPQSYLAQPHTAIANHHVIPKASRLTECLMNGLRLAQGISRGYVMQRTGLSDEDITRYTQPLIKRGLLTDGDAITCTPLGWQHLDTVLAQFP